MTQTAPDRRTVALVGAQGSSRRYLHAMWLLAVRDLRLRYATSVLGYLWSVLDPLVMSLIYWFVFTKVFHRGHVGEEPYILFLIVGMLPWVWFSAAVNDFTRAFSRDAKLVRSTAIPRSVWTTRIVVSKGIEYLCSLPVIAIFALLSPGVHFSWQGFLWFPVAVVMQMVFLVGLGLLIAPLCTLWNDLERTTKLILRALFYASPIIYNMHDLPRWFRHIASFNPLAGDIVLYRMTFFPHQWDGVAVIIGAVVSVAFLVVGWLVFRRLEPSVLKEL